MKREKIMRTFHHIFNNVNGGGLAELKIFIADPLNRDPNAQIEEAVQQFVHGRLYNDYIEEWLDDPWLRLVICGIGFLVYNYNQQNGVASFHEALPGNGHIYVLFAHPKIKNPKLVLDNVVDGITNGLSYNAFVEHTRNNPYVRIVILGINNLPYEGV